MELIIAFIILVATIVIGVPVVYSFGLTSIWLVYSLGFDASFVYTTMYSKMNGVVLLAIPLFIILGGVMEKGGVGSALVEMVEAFIGRLKGALCFVASVACAVFGAICGSGAATLSCIGSILAPKMRDRKYPIGHRSSRSGLLRTHRYADPPQLYPDPDRLGRQPVRPAVLPGNHHPRYHPDYPDRYRGRGPVQEVP